MKIVKTYLKYYEVAMSKCLSKARNNYIKVISMDFPLVS